jgi:hypothetical protein
MNRITATFFFNAGIPVKIDAQHAIARTKVMIIEGGFLSFR